MGNKNEGYLGGIMGGESRVESGSAGSLDVTTTNSTTSHGEEHTADGTFSTVGDVIVHDGWNQQNTAYFSGNHSQANDGTVVVSGGNITVDVEVWGAAGGSGQGSYTGYGGGGEYRKARMVLKPGTYYWMVGGGGGTGSNFWDRQGSGGWGGGGSSGSYNGAGNDATAWGNGGDISTINNTRTALGAGGGGLTGLFGATSASQADALLVAGGGGGYGFNQAAGHPGGSSNTTSGSDSAGGVGTDDGAAGKGGHGDTNGGGGGGGYWGGAGALQNSEIAGGGRGFTVTSDGHALVGTVSNVTTEAGSGNTPGGSSSSNFKTDLATSTSANERVGRGGRIAITIVDVGGGGGGGLQNTGILSLEEAGTQVVGGTAGDDDWDSVTLLLDGSSLTDASTAANNFTAQGDAAANNTVVSDPYGGTKGSFIFDGAGDALTSTNGDIIGISNPFTVEMWVRPDSTSTYQYLDIYGPNTGTGTGWTSGGRLLELSASTTSMQLQWWNGSTSRYNLLMTNTMSVSTWHHVAVVYDGTGMEVYVDGSSIGSMTGATTDGSATNTVFGIYNTGALPFDGRMHDIRITKGVARYTADFTPPTESFPTSLPVGGLTLPQLSWGGITGHSVLTEGSLLVNTGIFSLEEIYELTKSLPAANPIGGHLFDTAGSYSFTVPADVTSVSIVAVGGGGGGGSRSATGNTHGSGGGGALYYVNDYAVTPGSTLDVVVGSGGNPSTGNLSNSTDGGDSYVQLSSTDIVRAKGGGRGTGLSGGSGGSAVDCVGDGGGSGGAGTRISNAGTGGGGAGGYSGNGGAGGATGLSGTGGAGGGGGQHHSSGTNGSTGGGGGVGVYGEGSSGTGGASSSVNVVGGHGGSGGADGSEGSNQKGIGGAYGGGGGSAYDNNSGTNGGGPGAGGAVRIIWGSVSGAARTFPTTNVTVSTDYTDGEAESLN